MHNQHYGQLPNSSFVHFYGASCNPFVNNYILSLTGLQRKGIIEANPFIYLLSRIEKGRDFMKRSLVFLTLCFLLMSMVSTTAMAHTCVDPDRDYWCDDCGMQIYHTCIDANKDTWCDKCSCWIPHTCADKNSDHECDQCGRIMDVNVNITVTSYLSANQNIHLVFYEGTYPSVIANVYGSPAQHTFRCAANSRFQLQVNKYAHPSRTYFYNTKNDNIDIDVKLYPYGDASQDGTVNMGDVAQIYAHIRNTAAICDDYALKCADATGEGDINMGDVASVYAHVRGTTPLF